MLRCAAFLIAFLHSNLIVQASHDHEYDPTNPGRHERRAEMQVTLAVPTVFTPTVTVPKSSSPSLDVSPQIPSAGPAYDTIFSFPQERTSVFQKVSGGLSSSMGYACPSKMLVMAYYPDWIGSDFPPNKIDFSRFDWIDFAFAVPNSDFDLKWDEPKNASALLKELVLVAHTQGAKAKLSIGGWTGSKHFSTAVATEKSRKKFAKNILATYLEFELDGIDIDWEYPGKGGGSGNHVSSDDATNFLLFLKHLRTILPPTARISAAVETTTFVDSGGAPMQDLREFASVLDWILLMDYDVWGSSSRPGPNAPLHDACNNSSQPDASAVAGFNAWTSANFPACKIVLGLPSYGYISSSTAEHLRTRSRSTRIQRESSSIAVISEGGDTQIQFRDLVRQGALIRSSGSDQNSTAAFVANAGFERRWDSCSDTPYLRSTTSKQVITYDDPESIGLKAAFAKQVGMLGVNLFDVHGDTDKWDLTDSARKSIGLL
ncbi:glycoside hydrolase family 18 protein [Hebeloma cylindrosporum]|uniref:Glycoside hydrolase family 18 protein n=1 Tax=Hebeloma cylindrosporum TaxID=76867 RepID=A0A0C2YYL2_HEBCY|nr:glycoside hydrolase family 18 protein [Hebeloma cylindrosporum h7]